MPKSYKEVIKEALQGEITQQRWEVSDEELERLANAVVMSLGHEGWAVFQP